MKRESKKIFSIMLKAIESEILLMDRYGEGLSEDELKFRLYLLVDKLDFIEAMVDVIYKKDKETLSKLEYLNNLLKKWYEKVFESGERDKLVYLIDSSSISKDELLKFIELPIKGFLDDYGDFTEGAFLHGGLLKSQLDLFSKCLLETEFEQKLLLIKEFLLQGNSSKNSQINTIEKILIIEMLKN